MSFSCLTLFSNLSLTLGKRKNAIPQTTRFFKVWYMSISPISFLPALSPGFLLSTCMDISSLASGPLHVLFSLSGTLFSPTLLYLSPPSNLSLNMASSGKPASNPQVPVGCPPISMSLQHPVLILLEYSVIRLYYYCVWLHERVGAGYILLMTVPQHLAECLVYSRPSIDELCLWIRITAFLCSLENIYVF